MRIGVATHRDPLVDTRIHGVEGFGGGARVLGGIQPSAELQHPAVEFGDEGTESGLDRKVDADIPSRDGEAQRGLVARAEQLEDVEECVEAGALDVDDDRLELVDGFHRNHELVLQEAGRAVGTVPLSEHIERVIKLRQVLDLAAVGAGLAVPEFSDRPERVLVGQPIGKDVGEGEQLRRIEFQRVPLQLLR